MSIFPLFDDEALLSRLRAGEEDAFNLIYKQYWKTLYNEAYKRLNDAEVCEEIVQDIFADLWVKRKTREIKKLLPYLVMAVRYQVYALYEKTKSLPFFEEPLEYMALSTNEADSQLFLKELSGFIDAWLETEPEKRREIFKMRYFEDKSTKEISEQLGVSQKTVQNTLLTATNGLRTQMSKFLLLLPLLLEQHK